MREEPLPSCFGIVNPATIALQLGDLRHNTLRHQCKAYDVENDSQCQRQGHLWSERKLRNYTVRFLDSRTKFYIRDYVNTIFKHLLCKHHAYSFPYVLNITYIIVQLFTSDMSWESSFLSNLKHACGSSPSGLPREVSQRMDALPLSDVLQETLSNYNSQDGKSSISISIRDVEELSGVDGEDSVSVANILLLDSVPTLPACSNHCAVTASIPSVTVLAGLIA